MALSAGSRLGPYEIVALISSGGMGEVYRARDTKLHRDVALKVLPDSFANDPDRLARSMREAQVLASLNHPNIAHIHGLEDSGGVRALVMELVEGPTLADRIADGAILLADALPIAKQIAEALEAAHEQGIVHRDLKPANIKVRRDGTVKVLDFGLAKALDPPAGTTADAVLANLPTITGAAMTQPGVILGTAAYMSPEQARGLALDKRTDIWAFGCVFYEMLCGRRAFDTDGISDTLACVLMKEPSWTDLPSNTPVPVRRLLHRALVKDRKARLADMQDARIEIDEALRLPAEDRRRDDRLELLSLKTALGAVVLVSLGVLGALLGSRALNSPLTSAATTRLSVLLPPEISVAPPGEVAISPDGQTLVFVGQSTSVVRLYTRRLDEPEPRPLAGTENAAAPFFSPDGQWIAFVAERALKKIPLRGGPSQVLCRGCTSRPIGGYWGPDGRIIIATWPDISLLRVPADGGTPEVVSRPSDKAWFMWPTPAGDRTVLFTTWRDGQAGIDAVSLVTGERRTIITSGSHPRYVAGGHLVYLSEGRLLVVSFDPERLETRGSARVAIDGATTDPLSAVYDVSSTGTLTYVTGSALAQVVWKDRHGQTLPLTKQDRRYSLPALSSDGTHFAVTIREGFTRNLWVGSVGQQPLTRLTFGNDDVFAVWTPDGKRIVFSSGQGGRYNLFVTAADGSGRPEALTDTPESKKATSISPSGDFLLFNYNSPSTGLDIWQMSLNRHTAPRPYIQTPFNEAEGMLSPDGRWVAYMSDETGRNEVYLRAYAAPGGKKRISIDGGTAPAWNTNGRELFYHTGDALMAVSVAPDGQTVRSGVPTRLFQHQKDRLLPGRGTDYSVARDGQRFLMVDSEDGGKPSQSLNVVLNWLEELKDTPPPRK